MDRMSSRVALDRNCCPPMECRPPDIAIPELESLARRMASLISSVDSGRSMLATWVWFSNEWISLTVCGLFMGVILVEINCL